MKEPSEAARAVNLEQRNKKDIRERVIIIVMAIVIMSSIRRIVDNKRVKFRCEVSEFDISDVRFRFTPFQM